MIPVSTVDTGDIESASGTPFPPHVGDDESILTNFMSIQTTNTTDTLALLTSVVFRSADPILSDLLHTAMNDDHDPGLIKTDSDDWQDNIVDNLRKIIATTLFPPYVSASQDTIRQQVLANIHFGKTNHPTDGSIYNDMQLRHAIKRCDLTRSSGRIVMWVRHTLVFPISFMTSNDWTTVHPQDQVTPDRQSRIARQWARERQAALNRPTVVPAPTPGMNPPGPVPLSFVPATPTVPGTIPPPPTTPFPVTNPPTSAAPAPTTSPQFQQLLQSQIDMQATLTDLGNIAKQLLKPKPTPTPSYVNSTQSNAIFWRPSLPPDVIHRYDNRGKPLTKTKVQPFSNGDYYYHDPHRGTGSNLTIVITGHILYHDYVPKEFRRSLPTCIGTSYEYLRSYYNELYEVCMNKGIYIPHYFLLRYQPMMRHSMTGFEFGSGKDLPQQLEIRVPSWSGDLLHALRKAFPDKSRFHQIAHMERDGYSALHMIFGENHPNLDPIPLSLTDTPPVQRKDQSIYHFWTQYRDHLHLKSWVENVEKNLDTEAQVDLFLTKCNNSAYLRRESTSDRRSDPTAFQTRYTGTRLPTTIKHFLDSARYRDGSIQPERFYDDAPSSPAVPRTNAHRSGSSYHIRQLWQDDCDQGVTPSTTTTTDNIEDIYIQALRKQATTFQKRTPHCLLCHKKDHFFNACPTIDPKDTKLHLRLQLQINELLANIKQKGADNVLPIHAMTTSSDTTSNDQAPTNNSSDFHQGSA